MTWCSACLRGSILPLRQFFRLYQNTISRPKEKLLQSRSDTLHQSVVMFEIPDPPNSIFLIVCEIESDEFEEHALSSYHRSEKN